VGAVGKIHENGCDEMSEEPVSKGRHGTIAIANGQVQVTDPEGDGQFPVLVVPQNFQLPVTIDGESVGPGEYTLHSGQQVAATEYRVNPVCSPEMRVSNDRMSVVLSLFFHNGTVSTLADAGASPRVILKANTAPLPAMPLSYEELEQAIQDGHFVGDLDERALKELAAATEPMERIVMRGKQPFPGKPAECHTVELPKEEGDDPLHRRMQLQTVKSGTLVAVIEEEVQPQPGRDVLGRSVPCRSQVRSLLPHFGDGVQRIDNKVFATRHGRLVFSPTEVDVIPRVELEQNVTPKDGYVLFDGDVTIQGDVEDGSVINATGIVQIRGGVYGSTVIGEKGVSIRGHCVKSRILAGWGRDLAQGAVATVEKARDELEDYLQDVERILEEAQTKVVPKQQKELSVLPWVVLDKYHTGVQKAIHDIIKQYATCQKHDVGQHMEALIRIIQNTWVGPKLKAITVNDIVRTISTMEEYLGYVKKCRQQDNSDIAVNAVTSSTVEATGSIIVSGKGVYASQLTSGRVIEVKGYARGGLLFAQDSVSVAELGAPSAAETKVVVKSRAGLIHAGVRHPNTLLDVGGRLDRNTTIQRDVNFGS